MAELVNVKKVLDAMQLLAAKAKGEKDPKGTVGYTQTYAVYVHEDREAYHKRGRAGFLLDVARELEGVLAKIVRDALKAGKGLRVAVTLASLKLQRESQRACPVDTGALRNSAFTRVE